MDRPLISTYRLQLSAEFTFDDAAATVPSLARLGISHLYLSPVLQAVAGSTHGYDVVAHDRASAELGGDEGFLRLAQVAHEHGLGLVVDIVPNHMAAVPDQNAWWWDVLEHGPASPYAPWFDIDWAPPEPRHHGSILLPVLDDHYGRVLDAGRLALQRRGGSLVVSVDGGFHVPVDPTSVASVLARAAEACGSDRLAFAARSLTRLPPTTERDQHAQRHADVAVLSAIVADLAQDPGIVDAIDGAVERLNGNPEALHSLLEAQHWRLAYWRVAHHELGYRRFFDIDGLIGVRVEDPEVFDATHDLVLSWVADGTVDGLRVDHPDGLRDPARYFARLRERAPEAWVVAEKILADGEHLRPWAIQGTTGYDALDEVTRLFVDPDGARQLEELGAELADTAGLVETAHQARLDVMDTVLGAEVARLADAFVAVCERLRRFRDFARPDLAATLRAVLASMGVYRSYVHPEGGATADDLAAIDTAVSDATRRNPDLDPELFDLLARVLRDDAEVGGPEAVELRMRFQQLSGAVMAKGVEDTTFYRHVSLLALNEVGSGPERTPIDVDGFHRLAAARAEAYGSSMVALTTHDTKRSEDTRAALVALTQVPAEWGVTARRWLAINDRHRTDGLPDRTTELLIYQTLVAAHPLDQDRLSAYLTKAMREAKTYTSWLQPDEEAEARVQAFAQAILTDERFCTELDDFATALREPARAVALAQKLVQLTMPGIPDIYQGTERWDLSLVDPDNRRPVDHAGRDELLDALADPMGATGRTGPGSGSRPGPTMLPDLADDHDGLSKLMVTYRALQLRRSHPIAFGPTGSYTPLRATGPHSERVVAFARGDEAITVVPRLAHAVTDGWDGTTLNLPGGAWVPVLGGGPRLRGGSPLDGVVPVSALFDGLPVCLLERSTD